MDAPLTSSDLTNELVARFRSEDYRPPMLPSVAMQVWQMSQNPNVEVERIRILLEQDQVLAGKMLSIAQSPVYAGKVPVASIRDAIMRLGLRTVGDVLLEAAMTMRVFRAPHYADAMESLRLHALAVAYLSRDVAQVASGLDPSHAFLSGLLHDVGAVAALLCLAEGKRPRDLPPLREVWGAVRQVHARASSWLGQMWKLPEEVVQAMGAHHTMVAGDEPCPLAAAVAYADGLAIQQKIDGGEDRFDDGSKLARVVLGLSPDDERRLEGRADEIASHLRARARAA